MNRIEVIDVIPDDNEIEINGKVIGSVNDRHAMLWRYFSNAEHIFIIEDVSLTFDETPTEQITIPLEESMLRKLIACADYRNEDNDPNSLWDEIDPSLPKEIGLRAVETIKLDSMWLDCNSKIPVCTPILVIHVDRDELDLPVLCISYLILRHPDDREIGDNIDRT